MYPSDSASPECRIELERERDSFLHWSGSEPSTSQPVPYLDGQERSLRASNTALVCSLTCTVSRCKTLTISVLLAGGVVLLIAVCWNPVSILVADYAHVWSIVRIDSWLPVSEISLKHAKMNSGIIEH